MSDNNADCEQERVTEKKDLRSLGSFHKLYLTVLSLFSFAFFLLAFWLTVVYNIASDAQQTLKKDSAAFNKTNNSEHHPLPYWFDKRYNLNLNEVWNVMIGVYLVSISGLILVILHNISLNNLNKSLDAKQSYSPLRSFHHFHVYQAIENKLGVFEFLLVLAVEIAIIYGELVDPVCAIIVGLVIFGCMVIGRIYVVSLTAEQYSKRLEFAMEFANISRGQRFSMSKSEKAKKICKMAKAEMKGIKNNAAYNTV